MDENGIKLNKCRGGVIIQIFFNSVKVNKLVSVLISDICGKYEIINDVASPINVYNEQLKTILSFISQRLKNESFGKRSLKKTNGEINFELFYPSGEIENINKYILSNIIKNENCIEPIYILLNLKDSISSRNEGKITLNFSENFYVQEDVE